MSKYAPRLRELVGIIDPKYRNVSKQYIINKLNYYEKRGAFKIIYRHRIDEDWNLWSYAWEFKENPSKADRMEEDLNGYDK